MDSRSRCTAIPTLLCLGALCVSLLSGCGGKVPTWGELTSGKTGTTPATDPASTTTQSAPPQTAPPVQAPPKIDPAVRIAEFQKLHSSAIDDNVLGSLLSMDEGLELVEVISAAGSRVTDHGLTNLYKLTSLKKLELDGTQVGDLGCASIGKVPSLEELTLSGSKISDAGIAHLANMTQLRRLVINGTQLTLGGWQIIGQLPVIEEVWIKQSSLNDDGMAALCNASTLKMLHMNETAITDGGLRHLGRLDELRFLNVSNCNVNCGGMAAATKGGRLKSLIGFGAQSTPLNDQGAAAIGGMKGLEDLNIAQLQGMTDLHFKKIIGGKKDLRSLIMHHNPLLTSNAVGVLKANVDLEHIDLSHNPLINNQCLVTFKKMKKLKSLVFDGTGITIDAVQELAKELPELHKRRGA